LTAKNNNSEALLSEQKKFVFIHVPKTGGNFSSRALLPLTDCRLEEAPSPAGPGEIFLGPSTQSTAN
jgi:hypothetical protein